MKTMKAVAVKGANEVEIVYDVPVPECTDYEVLLKIQYCGFCNGSDLNIIRGTLSKEEGMKPYPTILGHEGAGEVVAVGKKVRYIREGDRFIHNNLRPDVGNGYSKTYGGMAEYGLAADHKAMLEDGFQIEELPFYKKFQQVPRDFDLVHGAMLLSLSESLSAAQNFGVGNGKNVLIFGAGPMGTAVATYCKMMGAEVTIIDGQKDRLQNAQRVAKVHRTIDFLQQDVASALGSELFDIGIDAVGLSDVVIQASQYLKPGGVVGSMGVLKNNDLRIDVSRLKNNTRLHMLNFPYGEYDVMEENIRLIMDKKIRPEDYYSHIMPVEEIHTAIDMIANKEALKIILKIAE